MDYRLAWEQEIVSAKERGLGGRMLTSRGQLFGLPIHVCESRMQDLWRV